MAEGQPVKPAFSGEVSDYYAKIFAQHAHEEGPWAAMTVASKSFLPTDGGALLDLASGPGEPACAIASAMPSVRVISTDVAQDMVDKASARSAGIQNVECLVVDAQDLSQFESETFDVVTCCYGFMFCPEPLKVMAQFRSRPRN